MKKPITIILALVYLGMQSPLVVTAQASDIKTQTYKSEIDRDLTENQAWLNIIGATEAWKYSTGKGVRIAVLDDGVDGTHPALKGRVESGVDFVYSAGGQIPANSDSSLGDHGTAVATVSSGKVWYDTYYKKNVGISGVAPESIIIPVRVLGHKSLNASEETIAYRIAKGIEWAVTKGGADVVLMSLGVREVVSDGICSAITKYKDKVVFVAAAGNSGFLNMGPETTMNGLPFPAGCENSISVGALDVTLLPAPFSTFDKSVDIAAPGVRILSSTRLQSRKELPINLYNGTSVSAPMVAGAAAILLEYNKSLTAPQVKDLLLRSARDIYDVGFDTKTGNGLLNIAGALDKSVPFEYPEREVFLFAPAYDRSSKELYLAWTEPEKDVEKFVITLRDGTRDYVTEISGDQVRAKIEGDFDSLKSIWLETVYADKTSRTAAPVGEEIPLDSHPVDELNITSKWAKNMKDLELIVIQSGQNIPGREYIFRLTNNSNWSKNVLVKADSNGILPKVITVRNLPIMFDSIPGEVGFGNNVTRRQIIQRYEIDLWTNNTQNGVTIIYGKIENYSEKFSKVTLRIQGQKDILVRANPKGIFTHVLTLDKKKGNKYKIVASNNLKISNPNTFY